MMQAYYPWLQKRVPIPLRWALVKLTKAAASGPRWLARQKEFSTTSG